MEIPERTGGWRYDTGNGNRQLVVSVPKTDVMFPFEMSSECPLMTKKWEKTRLVDLRAMQAVEDPRVDGETPGLVAYSGDPRRLGDGDNCVAQRNSHQFSWR